MEIAPPASAPTGAAPSAKSIEKGIKGFK